MTARRLTCRAGATGISFKYSTNCRDEGEYHAHLSTDPRTVRLRGEYLTTVGLSKFGFHKHCSKTVCVESTRTPARGYCITKDMMVYPIALSVDQASWDDHDIHQDTMSKRRDARG